MALFGGQRDMALFRKLNKELITDIIDTEVYYYKVIIEDTNANLYGRVKIKFINPVKIPTLVDRTNAEAFFDEFGTSYKKCKLLLFKRYLSRKNIYLN